MAITSRSFSPRSSLISLHYRLYLQVALCGGQLSQGGCTRSLQMFLIANAIALLVCTSSTPRYPPYTPPRQTADQKRIMTGIMQRAAAASQNATSSVLRILNNTPGSLCHKILMDSPFANESSQGLLQLLRETITTAELAHSFRVTMGPDASLATNVNLSFYPNLYQTLSVGHTRVGNFTGA